MLYRDDPLSPPGRRQETPPRSGGSVQEFSLIMDAVTVAPEPVRSIFDPPTVTLASDPVRSIFDPPTVPLDSELVSAIFVEPTDTSTVFEPTICTPPVELIVTVSSLTTICVPPSWIVML